MTEIQHKHTQEQLSQRKAHTYNTIIQHANHRTTTNKLHIPSTTETSGHH